LQVVEEEVSTWYMLPWYFFKIFGAQATDLLDTS